MDHNHDRHTPSETDLGGVTTVFVIVLVATLLMWSGGGVRFFERDRGTIQRSVAPTGPFGTSM
jgi:hypothetical protein